MNHVFVDQEKNSKNVVELYKNKASEDNKNKKAKAKNIFLLLTIIAIFL